MIPEHLPFVAAAAEAVAPADAAISFADALLFAGIVLLIALWTQLSSLRREVAELRERTNRDGGASSQRVAAAPAEISPQVLAAIAAAVFVTCGVGHHIVAVRDPENSGRVWSTEGRRQIFESHRLR